MSKDKHCKKKKKKVICCDPIYIIEDCYKEKEVTFVHPVIRVKREHIKYVRRDVYEEKVIHEVIDPGAPTKCDCNKKHKKCKKKSKKK